nr:hypothetical protein [Sphingomonas sp. H160509]
MWGMFAWCCLVGVIGMNVTIGGSDAAGNGLATGIARGISGIALITAVTVTSLYLIIRWRPFRYFFIILMAIITFGMTAIL